MEELLNRCTRLLEFAPSEEVDEYSKKQLRKRIYEWHNTEKEYLANLEYFVNGKGYSSLLDAFYNVPKLEKMKIKFLKPDLKGKWTFSKPAKELMERGGKGIFRTFDYDPTFINGWTMASSVKEEMVMVMGYITKFFVPMSITTKSKYHHAEDIPRAYDPRLKKIKNLWKDVRGGMIPLEMRICLYTKKDRYSCLIDLLANKQKPHPLHKAPYHKRIKHTPFEYMQFDAVLANIEISNLNKRIFEYIFECGETTAPEVAHIFSISEKIASNNLSSLKTRDLVTIRKNFYYNLNMDKVEEIVEKLESKKNK